MAIKSNSTDFIEKMNIDEKKKRILFVDDEPKILQGLRRMLRSKRREWKMTFVEGGRKALDLLNKETFDVLVTDIRMPGVDGVELLKKVRKQYPSTMRIVLSGYADKEVVLHAINLIHQFLSKPCDSDMLKSVLTRALALRSILINDRLKRLISQMETLPSLPSLYNKIIEELQSPNASISTIGEIVSQDIGMTAKVLQLVNSILVNLKTPIAKPSQAVDILGLDTIKMLTLSIDIFSQFDQNQLDGLPLDALWSHSMTVGGIAKRIVETESVDQKLADEAFIAGLLHDVGKLVLVAELPEEYSLMFDLAEKEKLNILDAENKIFGATHTEVGAYLLGLWGLPESIVATNAFHHAPMKSHDRTFNTMTAVHVANALAYEINHTKSVIPPAIDLTYLAKLNLTDRLPVWREMCQKAGEPES